MNRNEIYNRYYGYYKSMFESSLYVDARKLCEKIKTITSWDNIKEEEYQKFIDTMFGVVFHSKKRASYSIYKLYLYCNYLDESKLSTDDFVVRMTVGVRVKNFDNLCYYAYSQKNNLVVECFIKLLFAVASFDDPIEDKVNSLIYLFIDEYIKTYRP